MQSTRCHRLSHNAAQRAAGDRLRFGISIVTAKTTTKTV
jgi:hypothetical protein